MEEFNGVLLLVVETLIHVLLFFFFVHVCPLTEW
jgi:hypothetical protein